MASVSVFLIMREPEMALASLLACSTRSEMCWESASACRATQTEEVSDHATLPTAPMVPTGTPPARTACQTAGPSKYSSMEPVSASKATSQITSMETASLSAPSSK